MGRWQCYGLGPLLPREVECLVHSRPTGQDPWERNYSSTKKSTSLVGWSISMEKPRSWRRFAGDGQTTLSLRWAVGTLPKKNGKYHRAEGAEPAKTAEAWSGEAAAAIAAQPTSWQRGGWLGWIFFFHMRAALQFEAASMGILKFGPPMQKNVFAKSPKQKIPNMKNTLKFGPPMQKNVFAKSPKQKIPNMKNTLKFGPPIQTMYCPKQNLKT